MRYLILPFILAITFPAFTSVLFAQQATSAETSTMLDPAMIQHVEAAVDKAIEHLAKHQQPDGSWPSAYGNNNGINAVCTLALLGRGHTPSRGPYQVHILKAINFLYSTQDPETGLYASVKRTHGPMYEHALSTLAMVEAYGYLPEPRLHTSIQKAIDLIVKTQNHRGGWRYQPVARDADISATVMQVVALHAARNARFKVPDDTMRKALRYVRACADPEGGFHYRIIEKRGPADGRTAAGVLCMQLLGEFDDPIVQRSLDWLAKRPYRENIGHFWYFNYYAMQAHFQAGGDRWLTWSDKVRKFMLEEQLPDGSWPSFNAARYNGPTRCYSTAMGAMTLQVYLHYLPAYQR